MKLVINYDFFNAIMNVNEPTTPLKIVKNEPKYYIFPAFAVPIAHMTGVPSDDIIRTMAFVYGLYVGGDLILGQVYKKIFGEDKYSLNANKKLVTLPGLLSNINVKTNYNMLLKSELYERRIKFESNDTGIIPIKEEKYIYVPSYGFDGKEKETSILQEHNIGSSSYILSVEEPEKQYRRVLVNNYI